jgi:predicted nuclease of predicted toxin-antitoxin system
MKLLLDANISWKICSALSPIFGDCEHVDEVSLEVPAGDFEIHKS